MEKTLREIFEKYAHYGSDAGHADKGSTHTYIEKYDELFRPYRNGCTFLEIGLAMGWSMKMWCEYFSNSVLYGADISVVFDPADVKMQKNLYLEIVQADATKEDFPSKFASKYFDIVIDDGSHMTHDQITTFNLLKHKMRFGGIYIIEDLLALDQERDKYMSLSDNVEIADFRHIKGRFDDALVIIKF